MTINKPISVNVFYTTLKLLVCVTDHLNVITGATGFSTVLLCFEHFCLLLLPLWTNWFIVEDNGQLSWVEHRSSTANILMATPLSLDITNDCFVRDWFWFGRVLSTAWGAIACDDLNIDNIMALCNRKYAMQTPLYQRDSYMLAMCKNEARVVPPKCQDSNSLKGHGSLHRSVHPPSALARSAGSA